MSADDHREHGGIVSRLTSAAESASTREEYVASGAALSTVGTVTADTSLLLGSVLMVAGMALLLLVILGERRADADDE